MEPGFGMKIRFLVIAYDKNSIFFFLYIFWKLCQQENSFLWRQFLECCYRNIIYCVNIKDELGSCCLEVEWNNLENHGLYFFNFWSVLCNRSLWCPRVNSWIHRRTGCACGPFFSNILFKPSHVPFLLDH
jgi:hypothetical protein